MLNGFWVEKIFSLMPDMDDELTKFQYIYSGGIMRPVYGGWCYT